MLFDFGHIRWLSLPIPALRWGYVIHPYLRRSGGQSKSYRKSRLTGFPIMHKQFLVTLGAILPFVPSLLATILA